MDLIEFSQNWNNKLDCEFHVTISIHNQNRYFKGNRFKQTINKVDKNIVEVVDTIPYLLHKIPSLIFMLDTGFDKIEAIRLYETMYRNKNFDYNTQLFDIVVFKIVKRL